MMMIMMMIMMMMMMMKKEEPEPFWATDAKEHASTVKERRETDRDRGKGKKSFFGGRWVKGLMALVVVVVGV